MLVRRAHGQSRILFLHMENARTEEPIRDGNTASGNLLINHMTNTHFLLSHVSLLYLLDFWSGKETVSPKTGFRLMRLSVSVHVPTGGVSAIPLIPPLIVTAHKRTNCDFFCESRRRDYTAFPCNHPPPPCADGGVNFGGTTEGASTISATWVLCFPARV